MQHFNVCGLWVLFLLPLFAGCSEDVQKQVVSQAEQPAPVHYNKELSDFLGCHVTHSGTAYVIDFTEPVVVTTDLFPKFGRQVYGFDYQSGTLIPNLEGRVVLFLQGPPILSQGLYTLDGKEHVRVDISIDVNAQKGNRLGYYRSKLYHNEWARPSNVRGGWLTVSSGGAAYFKAALQYRGHEIDSVSPADVERRLLHEVVQLHVKLASPDDIAGARLETVDNPSGRWEFQRISTLRDKLKQANGEKKRRLEKELLSWLRKAAEKGHVLAQQSIVDFYDPSSERGVVWGNKLEQYAWTAVLKHRRENVQEDRDGAEIKRILRREAGSADTGDLLAIRNANPSDVGLSAEELSEAKLLAADYIDQYVPTKE